MRDDVNRRVLVVGAGIGGLTAAIALRRVGVAVTVVDQAKTFGALGAGITLQPNATAMLAALGVKLEPSVVCSIGEVAIVNERGRVLVGGGAPLEARGYGALNIRRPDLHEALRAAAGDVPIELQRRVTGVAPLRDGKVRVSFEKGETGDWDFVVGADGVHSRVRSALLPPRDCEPRYSGQTCWRFVLEAPDLAPSVTVERWGPGRRVGVVPLSQGGLYIYIVQSSPPGTVTARSRDIEAIQQRFSDVDERLDAILDRARAAGVEPHHGDLIDLPLVHFGEGRVLLVGDAAHAMTPNLGQGAGMAIEDAGTLAWLWRNDELESLVQRFARHRRARVEALHDTSWQVGQMAHWRHGMARWARDMLLRAAPRTLLERSARNTMEPGVELAERLQAHLSMVSVASM